MAFESYRELYIYHVRLWPSDLRQCSAELVRFLFGFRSPFGDDSYPTLFYVDDRASGSLHGKDVLTLILQNPNAINLKALYKCKVPVGREVSSGQQPWDVPSEEKRELARRESWGERGLLRETEIYLDITQILRVMQIAGELIAKVREAAEQTASCRNCAHLANKNWPGGHPFCRLHEPHYSGDYTKDKSRFVAKHWEEACDTWEAASVPESLEAFIQYVLCLQETEKMELLFDH